MDPKHCGKFGNVTRTQSLVLTIGSKFCVFFQTKFVLTFERIKVSSSYLVSDIMLCIQTIEFDHITNSQS